MTPTEARHFLETCNDQIEAGSNAELRRQILDAHAIVAADLNAKREAEFAAIRADLAARRRG